jgi:hypothetical protein
MTLSGGRNDTVMDNHFENNGAWGTLFVPYPDSGTPPHHEKCSKNGGFQISGIGCVFEAEGNALKGNTYAHDGYFGNPTNADFGQIVLHTGLPSNCYADNTAPAGSVPANLEQLQPVCGVPSTATNLEGELLTEVECDSSLGSCPAGASYPAKSGVKLAPLPSNLSTMPNPCAGVPSNPWCSSGRPIGSTGSR